MSDHPQITPEELAHATEVYLRTGSYSDAGRAIGRDISATRKALRNAGEPDRAKLYARAMDGALAEAIDAERLAVRLLRKDLKKPKGRAAVVSALGDATRTLITARSSHAKLTGEHAPEKHALIVTNLSDAELDAELAAHLALKGGEGAADPAAAGEGAPGG